MTRQEDAGESERAKETENVFLHHLAASHTDDAAVLAVCTSSRIYVIIFMEELSFESPVIEYKYNLSTSPTQLCLA